MPLGIHAALEIPGSTNKMLHASIRSLCEGDLLSVGKSATIGNHISNEFRATSNIDRRYADLAQEGSNEETRMGVAVAKTEMTFGR